MGLGSWRSTASTGNSLAIPRYSRAEFSNSSSWSVSITPASFRGTCPESWPHLRPKAAVSWYSSSTVLYRGVSSARSVKGVA